MAIKHLLTRTDEVVLTAVAALGVTGQSYGMSIFEQCSKFTKGRYISIGSIYTILDRLEKKGFVESWFEDRGGSERHGTKRCFRITGEGTRAVREAAVLSRALWRAWNVIPVLPTLPGGENAGKPAVKDHNEPRAERAS
jgi:PadR family transcriptional regulator, regulatory protein PadR